jgi:hypothetical protein
MTGSVVIILLVIFWGEKRRIPIIAVASVVVDVGLRLAFPRSRAALWSVSSGQLLGGLSLYYLSALIQTVAFYYAFLWLRGRVGDKAGEKASEKASEKRSEDVSG